MTKKLDKELLKKSYSQIEKLLLQNMDTIAKMVDEASSLEKIVVNSAPQGEVLTQEEFELHKNLTRQTGEIRKTIRLLVEQTKELFISYQNMVGDDININPYSITTKINPPIIPLDIQKKKKLMLSSEIQKIKIPIKYTVRSKIDELNLEQNLLENTNIKNYLRDSIKKMFLDNDFIIEDISIIKGSINICGNVLPTLTWINNYLTLIGAGAFISGSYAAITKYKDFREGVNQLYKDVTYTAEKCETDLKKIILKIEKKTNSKNQNGKYVED